MTSVAGIAFSCPLIVKIIFWIHPFPTFSQITERDSGDLDDDEETKIEKYTMTNEIKTNLKPLPAV